MIAVQHAKLHFTVRAIEMVQRMDTGQKTESIAQLIEDIQKKAVVLPEFQRDFVWEIEKTFDLFDSFVRDIFVGSLIYGIPSFEITVRDLDARPRKGQGSRAKIKLTSYSKAQIEKNVKTHGFRLLLDGQQRATFLASSKVKSVKSENAGSSKEFYAYLVHLKNLENMFRQEKLISYYLLDTDA